LHNDKFEKTDGYCTDVFFRQALGWIEQVKEKPFYCHIATNAPHAPLDVPEKWVAPYKEKVPLPAARFFGMIANIDENVGQLMTKLKEWNLDRDTLVIFMTDNGGTAGVKVFNAGMRGQKVTPYRGGVRVPCFWRWKGKLPEGVDVDRLTAHVDMFPTLTELAGVKVSPAVAAKLEGRSLVPLLNDRAAAWPDRTLVTHVGRWPHGKAAGAKLDHCSIRTAQWRMVNTKGKPETWELYDEVHDPGEAKDVAGAHPEIVRELTAAYDAWWQSVQPSLVNEDVVPPKENAFKTMFVKQFGAP
jgi:arylsulfatase